MAKPIMITSDSTTDLGEELLSRYNIPILPMTIVLGDRGFTDGRDITPDDIYEHYRQTGELPKTSANNYGDCYDFFKTYTDQGYAVVHFSLSGDMSSTYQNDCLAAAELEDVYVVDTRNLSTGGGLLVLEAARMREEGVEAAEIARRCRETAAYVNASFVIDSLEFLYKGGRCSAVEAFGANLLKIKPCIAVRNGKMGVARKYRGKFEAVLEQYINDQLADPDSVSGDHVFVTHAGCDPTTVEQCVNAVKQRLPGKTVYITRAGCTISSHCGQNTLGVLFLSKEPLAD